MTYTATAENLDQALAFAQAVADYCHSQEDYANEVDDGDDAGAWGDVAGEADALVEGLTRTRDSAVEQR